MHNDHLTVRRSGGALTLERFSRSGAPCQGRAWSLENGPVSRVLRGEEEWLRQCIEAATPGATVTQHDDGSSNSMHDLDIWVDGERVGAVEISAAVDPTALELWRLVSTPGQWTDPGLTGGWMVTVSRTAWARALKANLPGLLRALESQGVRRLDRDVRGAASVEREFADSLGIVSAAQSPTALPGSVYVLVELPPHQSGGGAPETGDSVAVWSASGCGVMTSATTSANSPVQVLGSGTWLFWSPACHRLRSRSIRTGQ